VEIEREEGKGKINRKAKRIQLGSLFPDEVS
jgi:hypothetical protein